MQPFPQKMLSLVAALLPDESGVFLGVCDSSCHLSSFPASKINFRLVEGFVVNVSCVAPLKGKKHTPTPGKQNARHMLPGTVDYIRVVKIDCPVKIMVFY